MQLSTLLLAATVATVSVAQPVANGIRFSSSGLRAQRDGNGAITSTKVSTWTSATGGYQATEASTDRQPDVMENSLFCHSGLKFGAATGGVGGGQILQMADDVEAMDPNSGAFTVFALSRQDEYLGAGMMLSKGPLFSANYWEIMHAAAGGMSRVYMIDTNGIAANTYVPYTDTNRWNVWSFRVNYTSDALTEKAIVAAKDGTSSGWFLGNFGAASNRFTGAVNSSTGLRFGGASGYVYRGQIVDVLMYPRALADAEMTSVLAWYDSTYFLTCPTLNSANAVNGQDGKTACSGTNARYWNECRQSCQAGFVQTYGGTEHMCMTGEWSNSPLVCERTCPALSAPLHVATCVRTLLDVDLTVLNGKDVTFFDNRWATWPRMPRAERSKYWNVQSGVIFAKVGTNTCGVARNNALFLSNPIWMNGLAFSAQVTWDIDMFMDNGVNGVVVRWLDENNHIRILLNTAANRHAIVVVSGGVATEIANATFTLSLGTTYNIKTVLQGPMIRVFEGSTLFMTANTTAVRSGSYGLFSNGEARFMRMKLTTDCDSGMSCLNAPPGTSCTYTCAQGYTNAGGSPTRACADDGSQATWSGTGLTCSIDPPVVNNSAKYVAENSPEGVAVGRPVEASSNAMRATFAYSIRQQVPSSTPAAFVINSCSGQLEVGPGAVVDYEALSGNGYKYDLTIDVVPNGDASRTGSAVVPVYVLDVNEAPFFNNIVNGRISVTVFEDAVAGTQMTPATAMVATDPDTAPAFLSNRYSFEGSTNPPGMFRVDPITGIIVVNRTGALDFESNPEVDLRLRVEDAVNPDLSNVVTVRVSVSDVNEAPAMPSPQYIEVDETAARQGATIRDAVDAVDPDAGDTITYSISASTANNNNKDPDNAGVTAVFSVDANTGILTWVVDRSNWLPTAKPIVVDGRLVRQVYNVMVTGTDRGPKSNTAVVKVYLMANLTASGMPAITSFTVRTPTLTDLPSTLGGQVMTIKGTNFVKVPAYTAVRVNITQYDTSNNRVVRPPYKARSCVITDATTVTCATPPGAGVNLRVELELVDGSGVVVPAVYSNALLFSYEAPMYDVVRNATTYYSGGYPEFGLLNTATGGRFYLHGKGFGLELNLIKVTYGPLVTTYPTAVASDWMTATVVASNGTMLTLDAGSGFGEYLVAVVNVAGQTFTASDYRLTFGYGDPVITNMTVPTYYTYTLSTMPTARYSAYIILEGYNFPPYYYLVNGAYTYPTIEAYYGNKERFPNGCTYSSPGNGCFKMEYCYSQYSSPFNAIQCLLPESFGANHTVRVIVQDRELSWQYSVASHLTARTRFGFFSHAPPIIDANGVTGIGTRNAETQGGQSLIITGKWLGPTSLNQAVSGLEGIEVRYGNRYQFPDTREFWRQRYQYVAQNCKVAFSDTYYGTGRIECDTAEGTGIGHSLRLAVGGQLSNNSISNCINYGVPIIASFEGEGAYDALTSGFQPVIVYGKNFGNNITLVNVSYTQAIDPDRVASLPTTMVYPIGPVGTNELRFTPVNCTYQTNHTALLCFTAPGAGGNLRWKATVDGQLSRDPYSSYGPAQVFNITVGFPPGDPNALPADNLNPNGAQIIFIQGRNFGQPPRTLPAPRLFPHLQWIRYALPGNDAQYIPTGRYTIQSHEMIRMITNPGYGANLAFEFMVGDQESGRTAFRFSYAQPKLLYILPGNGTTRSDVPLQYRIQVFAQDLPWSDLQNRFGIVMGQIGDVTRTALIICSRDATRIGTIQSVSCPVNSGIGKKRYVELRVDRPGVTSSTIVAQGFATFDYLDPYVSYISADPGTDPAWYGLVNTAMPNFINNTRVIQVFGRDFGLSRSDRVQRQVLIRNKTVGLGDEEGWTVIAAIGTINAPHVLRSWSHETLVFFTTSTTAEARVRIRSADLDAPNGNGTNTMLEQWSNIFDISTQVPVITSLEGIPASGFSTAGGELLTLNVPWPVFGTGVLAFNVQVGQDAALEYCTVVDRSAQGVDTPYTSTTAGAYIINKCRTQFGGSPNQFSVCQFSCAMPGHRGGTAVPVLIEVDGLKSGAKPIFFTRPSITKVTVADNYFGSPNPSTVYDFVANPTQKIFAPTSDAVITIEGANLGKCGTVIIGNYEVVDTCLLAPSARTHNKITIPVPGGEGSQDVDGFGVMRGFVLQVMAGDQANDRVIPFSFLPPIITDVSPRSAPTRGDVNITISGRNFGSKNANSNARQPDVTFYLNDGVADIRCENVDRLSHYVIKCLVPAGTGANLDVRVQTLDLVGGSSTNGIFFSYARPAITSASVETWSESLYQNWPVEWNANRTGTMANGTWPKWVNATGRSLALNGPTPGRYLLRLKGTNFGAAVPADVQPWTSRSTCALVAFNYADVECEGGANAADDRCKCQAYLDGRSADSSSCNWSWGSKITAVGTDTTSGAVWASPRCNGMEDFPGEGEIFDDGGAMAANLTNRGLDAVMDMQSSNAYGAGYVVSWDHEEVVLLMPGGMGAHVVTILARNQMPTMMNEVRFTYDAPKVTGVRSVSGSIQTGPAANDVVEIFGTNLGFGHPVAYPDDLPVQGGAGGAGFGRSLGIRSELAAELQRQPTLPSLWRQVRAKRALKSISEATALPGASVTVKWWLFCLSNALTYRVPEPELGFDGGKALEAFGCVPNKNSTRYTILKHSHNSILVRSHPGIGAARDATLMIHTGSRVMARVNVTFSYDAPRPVRVTPATIYVPNADMITLVGMNFGDESDLSLYRDLGFIGADELEVAVRVDTTMGEDAARVPRGSVGATNLSPSMSAITARFSRLTVGRKDVNVRVAGQFGWMFKNSSWVDPLYAVCSAGYFGRLGEACLECPSGAICRGYQSGIEFDLRKPVNQSDPVSANRPHEYPRPIREFYNMNSSDVYTTGMDAACPADIRALYPDRPDVCIVGCLPAEACAGDNVCTYGYTSKEPYYRCGSCDKGFYRRNNECVRCPDSPWMLVIGFILLAVTMCGVGFFLNKKNVNIAFLSIAVDYMQVVSMFAASRIAWPAEIKELLHILSAFNLNIEIIAPECIKPDISYIQKWSAIMLLPISACVVFLAVFAAGYVWKRFIKRQRGRAFLLSHQNSLIAMYLILFYFMYLYITRTLLEVFNCVPTEPSDGILYMAAVFEPCGKPGGTQLFLMPMAIAGLLLYTAGYPIFCAWLLYKYQFEVMLDQLLRAKGTGDTQMTNPQAHFIRVRFSRLYYQYKPDFYWWMLLVLMRKFMIAFTALMFRRDGGFQMAVALLVLFAAYALQVKWEPFMSPSDRNEVLRDHERARFEGGMHTRLAESLKDAAAKERKRTNKIDWSAPKAVLGKQILNRAGLFLFNYNTVEALLVGIAILICLAGIMFESLARRADNASSSMSLRIIPVADRQCAPSYKGYCTGLMWGVIMLIAFSMVYLAVVITVEVYGAIQEAKLATASTVKRAKMAKKLGLDGGEGTARGGLARAVAKVTKDSESGSEAALSADDFANRIGVLETAVNPLFANAKAGNAADKKAPGEMDADSMLSASAIADMDEPPNPALWAVMRDTYRTLIDQSLKQRSQLVELKRTLAEFDGMKAAESAREEELAAMYGMGGASSNGRDPMTAAGGRASSRMDPALDAPSTVSSPMGRGAGSRRSLAMSAGEANPQSQLAGYRQAGGSTPTARLGGKKAFAATIARE